MDTFLNILWLLWLTQYFKKWRMMRLFFQSLWKRNKCISYIKLPCTSKWPLKHPIQSSKHAQNVTENPLVKFFPPGVQIMTPKGVYRAAPAVLNQTRREPLFVQTGYHHFSRRHLISFFWADVTGGQFRKERRQPVLSFSSCLRVQPSQALLQQMILEIWESRKKNIDSKHPWKGWWVKL